MATTTVDINETPTQLSDLLLLTSDGTEVIIAKGGKTVARLVPAPQRKKRTANLFPGSIETTPDFDDELPDSFWLGEGEA